MPVLKDISRMRPANTNADRRRGPKWNEQRAALVRWGLAEERRRRRERLGDA